LVRFNDIVAAALSYNKDFDVDILRRAYIFSAKVHEGYTRASGEPYLVHPIEVGLIIASDMKLDAVAVISGLLHDTVEDTSATIEEIKEKFGEDVAAIVDGVTKLSSLEFGDTNVRLAENYRKMILAMSKDIRVILIKLADRLHNMRTLEHLPLEKQRKIAQETKDIYAPLANRLGLGRLKGELEDLALRYLNPEIYKEIEDKVSGKKIERVKAIDDAKEKITQKLADAGVGADITGRPKRFSSIYQKMTKKSLAFREVMDLMAVRVITKSVADCYAALGIIHSIWKPIPGEFDDYIAMPKANMYQSLHTAVIWEEGFHPLEIQIRTEEMHSIAEDGIAAHWKYKEHGKIKRDFEEKFQWLRQLTDMGENLKDSKEFMKLLKLNLFPDEVYVFSPGGEVLGLPKGSTPIDFAYAIHTNVGHTCVGGKINGRMVQLKYQLKTGDICEVLVSSSHKPNKDWLKLVKTPKAISEIKRKLRKEQSARSQSLGKEVCEKGMKRYNLDFKKLEKTGKLRDIGNQLGYTSIDSLMVAVGYGKISVSQILGKIIPQEDIHKAIKESKQTAGKRKPEGVKVKGMGDMMVRFAKCCNPVPGDEIVGFITRGRGATIHRHDCNITSLESDPERKIDVSWDIGEAMYVPVGITIISGNRQGLLADVSMVIASYKANIVDARIKVTEEGHAKHHFTVEVRDLKQLEKILSAIRSVKDVFSIERDKSARR